MKPRSIFLALSFFISTGAFTQAGAIRQVFRIFYNPSTKTIQYKSITGPVSSRGVLSTTSTSAVAFFQKNPQYEFITRQPITEQNLIEGYKRYSDVKSFLSDKNLRSSSGIVEFKKPTLKERRLSWRKMQKEAISGIDNAKVLFCSPDTDEEFINFFGE